MKTQFEGKFHTLPFPKKVEHMQDVGRRALSCWDYPAESEMKLLNYTENATFLISAEDREEIIMRVHRLDYASLNSIRTELCWIQALAEETDIRLARPLQSVSGSFVECITSPEFNEKRYVVCFSFLSGTAPADSSDNNESVGDFIRKIEKVPEKITIPLFKLAALLSYKAGKFSRKSPMSRDDRKLYRDLGEIAAKIHLQSETWKEPPYYERICWDFAGTFGTEWNNFYGESYRNRKWLSKKDIQIIDRCADLIEKRIDAYGCSPARFGMIHSDLRTSNLLTSPEGIAVLDFDDCGRGWYMYDIAGIVATIEHRPDIREIVKEVAAGYEIYRPLTDADREEIATFIMMRRIGMLQSILCRIGDVFMGQGESVDLTPEVAAFYAKGTALLAGDYLAAYETKALPEEAVPEKIGIM